MEVTGQEPQASGRNSRGGGTEGTCWFCPVRKMVCEKAEVSRIFFQVVLLLTIRFPDWARCASAKRKCRALKLRTKSSGKNLQWLQGKRQCFGKLLRTD